MAELLIRVAEKQGLIQAAHAHRVTTPGDVITVQPNGWNWGRKELENPEWRIWRLPTIDHAALGDLCECDRSRIAGGGYFIRARVRYLDLSSAEARALIARGQFLILDEADTHRVLSWRRTKPSLGQVG